MIAIRIRYPFVLAVAVLAGVLGACTEAVDPVSPIGRPFSLYGYLDPGSDVQAIRVFPIEDALFPAFNAQIDAVVQSAPAQGGEWLTWRDSSVAYPYYYGTEDVDTTWGNVFSASFRPSFGSVVRLAVRRSDGVESRVDVEVPVKALVEVGPPAAWPSNVTLPVRYEGDVRVLSTSVVYTVSSPEAREPWVIELELLGPKPPYMPGGESIVTVQLSSDLGRIFTLTGLTPGVHDLYLLGLEVKTFLVHPSWNPPGGVFDPELLVDPFVFTNVENGFGYVGSGYIEQTVWPVDQEVAVLAGFDKRPAG